MYGGSGKMGRGGGGAGGSTGKRSIHAPPINRLAPAGRLSMGGGGRGASSAATSSPSTSSLQVEESFSLVRENPLNFGMAIKLAPDLVEEIKRVEAQGGTARIKFDANSNNRNGNVIHVGEKTFKFTWSREPGDFCDIYEERRSGEDGNGLLVESGATWRKLNVERELDESTKNHVKRRSEEAERKLKSRKVQVLDPNNPTMKKHMRELVGVESNNTWRNFKHKKEPPFKKPKSEPSSAGGPHKSVFRSGLSTTLPKGKLSSGSPLASQPEQYGGPSSPLGSNNFVKGHASVSDTHTQNTNKTASSDKEKQSRLEGNANRDKLKHNQNMVVNPADLRSLMISLLLENQHKGMNLKALEKAIGDAMPNSVRQIEPILKQIATFQPPGKYFLKPGVEMANLKKPPPQSASSPDINCQQSAASQKLDQTPALDLSFSMRRAANDEEQGELNSPPVHTMDNVEKIDILQNSPEQFSDKKGSEHSERVAGSSSDNGSDSESDSDSDSSNSGSENGSRKSKSRSKSPVESRSGSSGSSSDSESDASSSSKQASDEDVDIMTSDDEKESKNRLQDSEPPPSNSPALLVHPDNEFVDIENLEKQDHDSDVDVVDSPRNSPEDDHHAERPPTRYPFQNEGGVPVEGIKHPVADNDEQQERQAYDRKASDGSESAVNDGFKQGRYSTHEGLSKPKSKRQIDDKHLDERAHNRKKSKSNNSSLPISGAINSIFGESPDNSSPDRPLEGPEGLINQIVTGTTRDGTDDLNVQTGVKQVIPGRFVSDSQEPGQKSFSEPRSGEKRPSKRYSVDHVKYSERSLQTSEGIRSQKGFNAEALGEDSLTSERRPMKVGAEGVIGDKQGTAKSHYRKNENLGKVKESMAHTNAQMGYLHKESCTSTQHRSPVMNDGGGMLRREYSDLELGEFREPPHNATPGLKKQFEMKNTDKHLKDKQMDSEYWESDPSKGKPSNMMTVESGKNFPPDQEAIVSGIPDGTSKRKAPENYTDDFTRPQQKGNRPMHQFNQSRGDHVEASSLNNKVSESNGKNRSVEAGTGLGGSLDSHGVASGKVSVKTMEQKHDSVRGIEQRAAKESKKQKPNVVNGSNDRRKDKSLVRNYDGTQKKKESSSDESCSPYTKYEKEEPELKGPIKDISQYQEYVNEYQEKYESYCSLNKILESKREEFIKYRKDLNACNDRDMKRYNEVVEQMRASYRQCGERHKRLKKIFLVLHEELKHLKEMIKDFAAAYRKD